MDNLCLYFSVHQIYPNAIQTTTDNVKIIKNTIIHADDMWLNVWNAKIVAVSQNRYGTFGRIVLNFIGDKFNFYLGENVISQLFDTSQQFADHDNHNTVKEHCQCVSSISKDTQIDDLSMVNCLVDETVSNCNSTTHMTATELQANICSKTKRYVDCVSFHQPGLPNIENGTAVENEIESNQLALITGSVGIVSLLLIAIVLLWKRVSKRSPIGDRAVDTISESTVIDNDSAHCSGTLTRKPSTLISVDDRVIIRQTLHRMKGCHPIELYEQVYNNTIQLLYTKFCEAEQRTIIGKIMGPLREIQKSGEEYIEFMNILKRAKPANGETTVGDSNTASL